MTRFPGILIAGSVAFLLLSTVGILVLGRGIFGPLAGAVIIWFVINALARAISRLRKARAVQRFDVLCSVLVFGGASVVNAG